ncbi:MAG: DUF4416 family protein [Spirochaetales bacterium]|nr:DUF4416 family protein [Spirochaetales bacterium]
MIAALLLAGEVSGDEVFARLEETWGPLDYRSGPFDFTWTGYYGAEMGEKLTRFYLSFEALQNPETLAGLKHQSNRLEDRWRLPSGRRVNIDPGLLSLGRVILASTKPADQRIPLGAGVYGEVTLIYRGGAFQALPWTYPDFRAPETLAALAAVRGIYKGQRRALLKGGFPPKS